MTTLASTSDLDIARLIVASRGPADRAPRTVAVVSGGTSREAEVSRSSARQVTAALMAAGHAVHEFELDRSAFGRLQALGPDVVFPVLHGGTGEDGSFQGALDILGMRFVGSGVRASATAMHKPLAKLAFAAAGLPLARGLTLPPREYRAPEIAELLGNFGPEVVTKPTSEGSGLGVTFCSDASTLSAVLREAHASATELMLERRIVGKEVTVGVLETVDAICAFAPIEVRTPENSWYDFEHRYTPGLSEHVIPAAVEVALLDELRLHAIRAHRALGCRHLSRADFIVDAEGRPCLLEVNTLPGMTPTSLFPDGAAHAGIDFQALMDHLVRLASR